MNQRDNSAAALQCGPCGKLSLDIMNSRSENSASKRSQNKNDAHDLEQTFALGDRSMGYLKEFKTPAIPRNYEIFYLHSSGTNSELSDAIRKAIAAHSCLTEEDAKRIYEQYVQPSKMNEQVLEVGGQVSEEIKELLTAVATASERTGLFGDSLDGITEELPKVQTADQLSSIVKKLVISTNEMSHYSHDLEMRLVESKEQIEDLHQTLETIRAESLTDQLTGLSNRKSFDQVLELEMKEALDSGEPLCLMLLDIDHFKMFNDTFGHQTGDQVLRLFAHTMKTNVKGRDLAARYGGEEFAIILPKTPLRAAVTVGEQIRKAVRSKELIKKSTGESLGRITMSVGIAVFKPEDAPETLIHRADKCLYAAKDGGRDQVKCETDPDVDLSAAAA